MQEKYVGGTQEVAVYVTSKRCNKCKCKYEKDKNVLKFDAGHGKEISLCFGCIENIKNGDYTVFDGEK